MLVFGGQGQVATSLREAVLPAGWIVRTAGRAECDVTVRRDVDRIVAESGAAVVINAAAHTAVDRAESEPEAAIAVNRDGARHIAEACARRGAPLIHLSTDYVFDGRAVGHAYREDDPIAPVSVYGASKAEGDQAVRDATSRHAIVRTAWVYGAHGQNFVKTMLRLGRERPELGIVADQHGCPSAAADIADALVAMAVRMAEPGARADLHGTFHFTGTGSTTWYGFAQEIFRLAARHGHPVPVLRPITTTDYPTPAARPANSVLDCSRLRATFGIAAPPWRDSLATCVARLCESSVGALP
ncbi:dTDP-4-dehydrorhamnose reductase [Skermanella stibiiresistens SB22]|uniref:dTDP-4-dehydrorhamnose reductase n=1 Tax=Skermanella stibiiresistens SB22 TaxID=1385369 RepID=W9HF49_9PROT|nr:dTDP-4-dehydrorhamnose reductase [Skermanella stibiiresistens SB22]